MKANIHPAYYPSAKVACACGNTFTVGSTREKIEVEICAACHPFYTGQEKVIDTAGRVERFEARRKAAQAKRLEKPRRPEASGSRPTAPGFKARRSAAKDKADKPAAPKAKADKEKAKEKKAAAQLKKGKSEKPAAKQKKTATGKDKKTTPKKKAASKK